MLIRIKDEVFVAHDEIACVEVPRNQDYVMVRMKDGREYGVGADYGKGVYETQRRLVAEINACFAPRE